MVEEFEKLVVLGPKGSFEPASKPELKVEPINDIYTFLAGIQIYGGSRRLRILATNMPEDPEVEGSKRATWGMPSTPLPHGMGSDPTRVDFIRGALIPKISSLAVSR
jgi:hypothetical protein